MRRLFQNGDVLFAEDVNAIATPIVDGLDYIGHGPKVTDDFLSDEGSQIKSKFYSFYNRLKVSVQSGLTINYVGGVLLLNNGALVSISPGSITAPNNTNSFVFVNSSGAVQTSTVLPNECFPMAFIVAASSVITTLTDIRDKIIDRISASTIPVQQLIPTGTGMEFWGTVLPNGWLWADGSTYLTTQYPALFAAIGYIHGGSGTQFKVPDKRGRVSVGSGQGTGLTNRALGQVFGEETVTLNVGQMPLHSHGINDPKHGHGVYDPGHAHGVYDPSHTHQLINSAGLIRGVSATVNNSSAGPELSSNSVGEIINTTPSGTGIGIYSAGTSISLYGAATGISINSQGGNGSHSNTQPSLVCNYIIKA